MEEGVKFDTGKIRWELMPPEIEEVVKVLTFGAEKYAPRNWERGMTYGRPFAATMRHCWAWVKGKKKDEETGLHPLAHAICELLFLLAYDLRGMNQFDDLTRQQVTKDMPGDNQSQTTEGIRPTND